MELKERCAQEMSLRKAQNECWSFHGQLLYAGGVCWPALSLLWMDNPVIDRCKETLSDFEWHKCPRCPGMWTDGDETYEPCSGAA